MTDNGWLYTMGDDIEWMMTDNGWWWTMDNRQWVMRNNGHLTMMIDNGWW